MSRIQALALGCDTPRYSIEMALSLNRPLVCSGPARRSVVTFFDTLPPPYYPQTSYGGCEGAGLRFSVIMDFAFAANLARRLSRVVRR
jgi:hypothetical protein